MGNVIHRNTVFIEAKNLVDFNSFNAGNIIGVYRDPYRESWIVVDPNGQRWCMCTSNLRNENYFKFIHQYSISDIIYKLMEINSDYETVMWDMLEDAVNTTFKEAKELSSIEDIYKYISKNLI